MACTVPTAFPSDCASDVVKGIISKDFGGREIAAAFQVASYLAHSLEKVKDEDGVLKITEPLDEEHAVHYLGVLASGTEALDLGLFKPLIDYLIALAVAALKKKFGG